MEGFNVMFCKQLINGIVQESKKEKLMVHDVLQRLYNLGARKFVIAGLGQMGCIPSILAQSMTGTCSKEVNLLVKPFNENVKTMLGNFNNNLPGARFIFADSSRMFQDILLNARSYGTMNQKILLHSPQNNTNKTQCYIILNLWFSS